MTRYLHESIENSCYDTDEDHSANNIPNYTLFHNTVLDIYKECKTLEFSYSVVASKWKNAQNIPSLQVYLKWRTKIFKDYFEELPSDHIATNNLFFREKSF